LADSSAASSAVELSGSELKGGTLSIEIARPRAQKGGQDFKSAKSPGFGASGGFQQGSICRLLCWLYCCILMAFKETCYSAAYLCRQYACLVYLSNIVYRIGK